MCQGTISPLCNGPLNHCIQFTKTTKAREEEREQSALSPLLRTMKFKKVWLHIYFPWQIGSVLWSALLHGILSLIFCCNSCCWHLCLWNKLDKLKDKSKPFVILAASGTTRDTSPQDLSILTLALNFFKKTDDNNDKNYGFMRLQLMLRNLKTQNLSIEQSILITNDGKVWLPLSNVQFFGFFWRRS